MFLIDEQAAAGAISSPRCVNIATLPMCTLHDCLHICVICHKFQFFAKECYDT